MKTMWRPRREKPTNLPNRKHATRAQQCHKNDLAYGLNTIKSEVWHHFRAAQRWFIHAFPHMHIILTTYSPTTRGIIKHVQQFLLVKDNPNGDSVALSCLLLVWCDKKVWQTNKKYQLLAITDVLVHTHTSINMRSLYCYRFANMYCSSDLKFIEIIWLLLLCARLYQIRW